MLTLRSPKYCLRYPQITGMMKAIVTLKKLCNPRADEKLSGKRSLRNTRALMINITIIKFQAYLRICEKLMRILELKKEAIQTKNAISAKLLAYAKPIMVIPIPAAWNMYSIFMG